MSQKNYILLTIILCFTSLNAQHKIKTSTETLSFYNGITGQDQIIQEYIITNNSSEDYLTWISLDIIKNKSDKEIIHDYFKKIKGDFNLTQMMYEGLLKGQSVSIGYTFIKKISPGQKFTYIVSQTNKKSNIYQNRIVIISKRKVEQTLRMKIYNDLYFKPTYIFLTDIFLNDINDNTIR